MHSTHATCHVRRLILTMLMIATTIGFASMGPGSAKAAGRSWSVAATCGGTSSGANPTVNITVINNTGLHLYVAYAHSLATSQAINTYLTGLKLEDPGPQTIVDIPDGGSKTLAASSAGGDLPSGAPVDGALVITSGGLALTSCQDSHATVVTLPGPLPTVSGEEGMESAAIAAKTIGQLESYRAYAPLYALLHPDSQAQFSFGQMACWYVGQYGLPGAKGSTTIYSTDVQNVKFVNWTWVGGLKEYAKVAEVSFTQKTGVFPKSGTPVSGIEHLVRVDGVWRWFFGTAVDSAAHMTGACGLPPST